MKKLIIGTVVGTLILYAWYFLSWTVLPLHMYTMKHVPGQKKAMQKISAHVSEKGAYAVPLADNRNMSFGDAGEFHKKNQELMKEFKEMPAAFFFYFPEGLQTEPMRYLTGFILQLFSVLVVCIILVATAGAIQTFTYRLWLVMLIAFMITFEGHLLYFNWMYFPWHFTSGFVIDTLISWFLCGLWLSWYFGEEKKRAYGAH